MRQYNYNGIYTGEAKVKKGKRKRVDVGFG